MRSRRTYLLRWAFCALFTFAGLTLSIAQEKVGVDWHIPANLTEFERELDLYKDHHISFLIVDQSLTVEQASLLDTAQIPFLLRLDNKFLTKIQFQADSLSLRESIEQRSILYDSSSTFKGIIAFSHSYNPDDFSVGGVNLYAIQADSLKASDTVSEFIDTAVFLDPENTSASSIYSFKQKLITRGSIIVDSNWLTTVFNEFPDFKDSFLAEGGITPGIIPLPKTPKERPLVHWSILILILLWGSLAVNVATNPTYLETIPRYFTSHRFFVDDIMSYRERSSASAIFLLFQHALFGGLVTYILAKIFISPVGLEALYFQLPYLGIMGQNYFSLFVVTGVLILAIELMAILWLYFPNKEMTHFNQALNLFTWIFHLDFILVTLMVTAYFAEWSSTFIVILSVFYLLIWFSSFNITALGASKRLGMNRNAYLIKTIVLHSLITILFLSFLLSFDTLWDILELVISV